MSSKALLIEHIPGSPHYKIRFDGGGEVPHELTGSFTSVADAKIAINVWECTKRDEPVEVKQVMRDEDTVKRGRPPKALGA